ncbi:methyl-accepting chemotaxis protein II (aspartate chemoreceptor protein) [Citrobacter koseri]|uniref:Methyl-accepting chemotaxis protein II (Aspartate chemoreceptor protein) n=1 Tax=Citrobacter koseri TaxID=545 RepID=A0A2X2VF63_CITKO|nr:methyl-accepting chemotaxis protein II (aspartate chemoreceptor protein) [Citrobacter koseri]
MFNRIRVVTMLMMVLGVFALLQLVSGGLLFSSLQQNQQSFVISNDLRQQQSELTSTWDLMLQTRINLSRSSARMMMDASNQQSSAKNDLAEKRQKHAGAGGNALCQLQKYQSAAGDGGSQRQCG